MPETPRQAGRRIVNAILVAWISDPTRPVADREWAALELYRNHRLALEEAASIVTDLGGRLAAAFEKITAAYRGAPNKDPR